MACNLPISDRRSDWERTLRTAGRENTDWGSILGHGGNVMRFGGHGLFSLLLFLVCGALIGGIIGQVLSQVSLSGMIPYLTKTYEIFDFKDIYLNLAVIDVHFGIRFAPNLISIFGILLAAWVYKRF